MSLRINNNVLSVQTYGNVAKTSQRLEKSIQKLSSGLRINSAADDAAGLAISEKMRRQIRGLNRAVLNAQDGISMIQTAEGALNESHSILQRMRELAIQSSNDTLTSNDRLEIQKEVTQLRDDLDRIARNTEFNTKKLLDGSQTALFSSSAGGVSGIIKGTASVIGGDYDVSIAMLSAGISEKKTSQIFTLNEGSGALADGGTQLQSIAQFYDANGVFVLDTPQILHLHGNTRDAEVVLDGQMTLDNLAADLQNAMVSSSGLDIENTRVASVNTAQTNLSGVGGYLEITSGSIGEDGAISFAADQKVLDSLGITNTRNATQSRVELTLRDSFGNVRQVKTETNRASGLLNGMDIKFESQAAQIAGTRGLQEGLEITVAGSLFWVSAGNTQVTIQVRSGSWSMEGLANSFQRQIDVANAGNGVPGLEVNVVEGELRFSYEKPSSAAGSISNTIIIDNVQAQASRLGFLEGSYSGFVDGKKEQSATVWGFTRFIDTAASGIAANQAGIFAIGDGNTVGVTIEITAYVTIGTAISSTSDLVDFVNFQSQTNNLLETLNIGVRMDQIGNALAFTSTRVGNENRSTNGAITSMVSLTVTATNAVMQSTFLSAFGLQSGTAKGNGDKNFRIHIVSNSPQFQIGADQGQSMGINIGEMTSEGLGVDNLDLTSVEGSQKAIGKLNKAIDMVSAERSKLGAFQNRLEFAINNLRNTHSNLTSAESRIRDADIAMEMIEFTRNQIVQQSGTAMLAQANAVPQGVLQLLQ